MRLVLGLDLWFVCLLSVEGFDSDLEFKFCISIPRQIPSLLPSLSPLSTLTLPFPTREGFSEAAKTVSNQGILIATWQEPEVTALTA